MAEPYRPVSERCEILAAEMTDASNPDAARTLYEADSHIRGLERDYHLMCEEDRRLRAGITDLIAICEQDARDQDHNATQTGFGKGSTAYAEGRGTACRGIATRLKALLPDAP